MNLSARNLIVGGLLAALVGGLFYTTLRNPPVPVDLHVVERGPMQVTVNADGKTRIRDIYEVAAPITGTARRSPVQVGDPVVAGQTVVAVVEPAAPALLDSRARREAEAAVREAEAARHLAESELRKAREDLAYAQSQFDRVQALVQRGVSSVTTLEDSTQQLAIAKAARDAAASGLDMAESSLERTRAVLIPPEEDAPGSLNGECCVRLHAPIDGTVLEVDMISERPVLSGARLLSIGRRDNLEIVADLLSADAVRLPAGARATVDRWGGEGVLQARLRKVEPVARTKVSALGIEEQRVDALFDILTPPEARAGLGEGFYVFLRIVEWEDTDALRVPLSALFRRDGGWAVFTVQDGTARLTPLRIGRRGETVAQVLDGLAPGVRVITHPSDAVADGVAVLDRASLE
ncbi:efflux RND transporter periplasmic adaptor subunit [Rhodovulum adriaticum]|uniref:HlyD family secretion protein n=1 Tax=Rhodovulum adriaticum TaxID=35804 RepID=A0A4V2SKY5_RHOAD|nr:HlyD family efflux transporter periplasmic adaptor subunit [Rhodovulum adriaticum]MBK1636619.1 RND transporter [Rhodovulum adriaticum]TCP21356.1 HlyD family secretion protein [Rhodovulum adriaticum]